MVKPALTLSSVNKMSFNKVMFCLIISVFAFITNIPTTQSLKNKVKPCEKIHSCTCIFPTGRGVNLSLINQNLSVPISNNVSITVHLCNDVSFNSSTNLTINQCQNVSICYMDNLKNEYLSLGKAGNMTFLSESEYKPMSIHFRNESTNSTNIALTCDQTAEEPKLKLISHEGSNINLELQSKHVCMRLLTTEEGPTGGISTGSMFIIMFLVFTMVYFGGGMLTLKLLRGAEGKEMIPNIDFWTDLPYLVRDGILFVLNGFQPSASYDRI